MNKSKLLIKNPLEKNTCPNIFKKFYHDLLLKIKKHAKNSVLKKFFLRKNTKSYNSKETFFLDASMLKCPQPLLETKKHLKNIKPQKNILVKTKDDSFKIDIKVFIKKNKHKLLKTWKENDAFFFLIKK